MDFSVVLKKTQDLEAIVNREEVIDILENAIQKCNDAVNAGDELVSDAVYDTLIDRLRILKPDSYLLHQVWSESVEEEFDEDLDIMLAHYPMLSIQTVKDYTDKPLKDFIQFFKNHYSQLRLTLSVKLNGHGVRIVYKNGYLVKATSRGRSTAGKNITKQMVNILGEYNEALADMGLVEVRAEVLLPYNNLELARQYNPDIKSAFTGVSSMIRESASAEENQLLNVVAYDILTESMTFNYLTEKYETLEQAGFEVPMYMVDLVESYDIMDFIKGNLQVFEEHTENYPYFLDGIVLTVDNISIFKDFGEEDKFRLGNLALKVEKWAQNGYSGVIEKIIWEEGKTKLTPVALLEGQGVQSASGSYVRRVPLYAPANILLLKAYKGNVIHFKYGGEAGVVPTTPDGRLLKEVGKVSGPLQEDMNTEKTGYLAEVNNHTFFVAEEEAHLFADTDEDDIWDD